MSNSFKSYKFTLGESPVRCYEGQRINPREGMKLGYDLLEIFAKPIATLAGGERSPSKVEESAEKSFTDLKSLSSELIKELSEAYVASDKKKYFNLFDKVMSSTVVLAKKENGKGPINLKISDGSFDEWFYENPKDLGFFTAAVLVENAAPFLPESCQNLMEKMNLMTAEGLKTQFQLLCQSMKTAYIT